MHFQSDKAPIYLQLIQRIKADIISGRLKAGDKMPSVRDMSESFKVNPNTIQRVLLELEREGITYSQRGIGTFVVDGDELLETLRTTQAKKYTHRFVSEMNELGMKKSELMKYLKLELEEHENENIRS
ncbi:GntR family transcriptional regulator [Desulfosporosinus fructosivorans]|uniref:GntR family transcriptional regulator n=1 Tax=Desulfosporosinus fructosivorans TaxID=2018669 RepID=A0A4Z0R0W1_9FIRM|nr:GntR family transcriptional regulator [Desulfosporosinus fructosivorans]TGE36304.1 GntR family transcriptional regulator [Desulfosporosinus fructosivorans]